MLVGVDGVIVDDSAVEVGVSKSGGGGGGGRGRRESFTAAAEEIGEPFGRLRLRHYWRIRLGGCLGRKGRGGGILSNLRKDNKW